jgi:outer membrane protein TolC
MRWLILTMMGLAVAANASAETLTLKDYLGQVSGQNQAVQGSRQSMEGFKDRENEADLLYTPQAFVNIGALYDQKPVLQPNFQPTVTRATQLSFGVMKQWKFGLSAKLSENLTATRLTVANPAIFPQPNFVDVSPSLELSQSLWRNGFGAETKAQSEAFAASLLAGRYVESFKVKAQLAAAEGAYWRLALAKELVDIQKDSLTRAGKLKDWASGRTRMDLADKADLLQADAAFRLRELELKAVLDEYRVASRAFNLARGQDSDEVKESLVSLNEEALKALAIPKREELRDDVKAAQQQERIAAANAETGKHKNSPTLDLMMNLSLNGRDPSMGASFSESLGTAHPYALVGLKFATPLDFGLVKQNKAGYEKERLGAELQYRRKVIEQESEWKGLVDQLGDRRVRLELARQIEAAQKTKAEYERDRLKRAKTNTYQVLLFEEDYANSRRMRLRIEGEILGIVAQMKTFGGDHESR